MIPSVFVLATLTGVLSADDSMPYCDDGSGVSCYDIYSDVQVAPPPPLPGDPFGPCYVCSYPVQQSRRGGSTFQTVNLGLVYNYSCQVGIWQGAQNGCYVPPGTPSVIRSYPTLHGATLCPGGSGGGGDGCQYS